jgi:hypothetical protein
VSLTESGEVTLRIAGKSINILLLKLSILAYPRHKLVCSAFLEVPKINKKLKGPVRFPDWASLIYFFGIVGTF